MTVTPLATRGKLLQAGAVVINERAAWQCVVGFSRGTKVIQLNVRIRGEKCEDSKNTAKVEESCSSSGWDEKKHDCKELCVITLNE